MTEQEQYEAVWQAAMAVADRLSTEAVEYDDEDGRAFNLTIAAGIVATAILAHRPDDLGTTLKVSNPKASSAENADLSTASLVDELADAGKALVDAITFDDSGAMIAGKYQGGNGGLISRETVVKADMLRRVLAKVGR